MPVYPVTDRPAFVAGVNSAAFVMKNAGDSTIFIGQDSSLTPTSRDFSMTPGSVVQWPGKSTQIWAMASPGESSEIEILYESQANFTPGPDKVSATIVGPVDVTGGVAVVGPVAIDGTVDVAGTVAIAGPVEIGGPVDVSGNVGISGPVDINGEVNVVGGVTIDNSVLNVGGAVGIIRDTQLIDRFNGTVPFNGNANIYTRLDVRQFSTLSIKINGGVLTNPPLRSEWHTFTAIWSAENPLSPGTFYEITRDTFRMNVNGDVELALSVKADRITLITSPNFPSGTRTLEVLTTGLEQTLPESYFHSYKTTQRLVATGGTFTGTFTSERNLVDANPVVLAKTSGGFAIGDIYFDHYSGSAVIPFLRLLSQMIVGGINLLIRTGSGVSVWRRDDSGGAAGFVRYFYDQPLTLPREPLSLNFVWSSTTNPASIELILGILFEGINAEK